MNQRTTHRLRRLFTFPLDNPRAAWRQFKRDFNAIPRPDRARALRLLEAVKNPS